MTYSTSFFCQCLSKCRPVATADMLRVTTLPEMKHSTHRIDRIAPSQIMTIGGGQRKWCKKTVKRSHLFRAYGRFLEQGVNVPWEAALEKNAEYMRRSTKSRQFKMYALIQLFSWIS